MTRIAYAHEEGLLLLLHYYMYMHRQLNVNHAHFSAIPPRFAHIHLLSILITINKQIGFWDPLGMLDDVDEERFQRLRYVELKHGRICQLAFLGQIVTRGGTHLPGDIDFDGHSFDSYPNGIAAIIGPDAIPALGLIQIIGVIGFLELFVMKDGAL